MYIFIHILKFENVYQLLNEIDLHSEEFLDKTEGMVLNNQIWGKELLIKQH